MLKERSVLANTKWAPIINHVSSDRITFFVREQKSDMAGQAQKCSQELKIHGRHINGQCLTSLRCCALNDSSISPMYTWINRQAWLLVRKNEECFEMTRPTEPRTNKDTRGENILRVRWWMRFRNVRKSREIQNWVRTCNFLNSSWVKKQTITPIPKSHRNHAFEVWTHTKQQRRTHEKANKRNGHPFRTHVKSY